MWAFNNLYYTWNFTTAICYKHKCKCDYCPNEIVCNLYGHYFRPKGMHPIKYATLNTLRNIGTEGLEKFFNYNDKNY